jgi:membrane protease subunit HflC
VVSRFGHIVRVVEEPGLHVKLPFERIVAVDRRLLYSKPEQVEYLTSDKKNVVVRSLALWRIADPKRFLETVRTRAGAEVQLADVVLAEVGAVLGNYSFASFVSPAEGQSRFETLVGEVRGAVQAYALPAFGIEVVDLDVRQLYLPEANKQSVFERMKAERGKIAKQFRSEGERDGNRMIAEANRDKARISAEAYAEAARTKAEGEARAMRIYAQAFERDPAFYRFLRTLQAYEKFLDARTTLFLPADAEILAILREDGAAADGPVIEPEAPVADGDELPAGPQDGRPRAEAADTAPGMPAPEAVP